VLIFEKMKTGSTGGGKLIYDVLITKLDRKGNFEEVNRVHKHKHNFIVISRYFESLNITL